MISNIAINVKNNVGVFQTSKKYNDCSNYINSEKDKDVTKNKRFSTMIQSFTFFRLYYFIYQMIMSVLSEPLSSKMTIIPDYSEEVLKVTMHEN